METPSWPEELFGPPADAMPGIDWAEVRARTGLDFPADYKEFASLYPALIIDEYLLISHPAGPHGFNLISTAEIMLERQRSWSLPEKVVEFDPVTLESRTVEQGFPLYPEKGGLFPWGGDGIELNGFWLTDEDPSQWTVVLTRRFSQWRYLGSLTEFLPDILSGRVTCPLLAADWPDPENDLEVQQLFG